MIVSIDPGLNECGVAWWHEGELVDVALIQSPVKDKTEHIDKRITAMADAVASEMKSEEVTLIVVERMEPRKRLESAWSTLLDLAYISGRASAGVQTTFLRPSIWTGGRRKSVNHKRIWSRLSRYEEGVLHAGLGKCPVDNHKELLDAVGIGLYFMERL